MNSTEVKKFLKLYFGTAIGVWIVVAALFGPGDLSCDYRSEYKEDHDRYLQIIKSVPYKRYAQRPHLNAPGMEGVPPEFTQDKVDFVKEYQSRDEFIRESRRSSLYTSFFKYFNAALVVWLAWRLGRQPLLKMLDAQTHELRDKIAAVRNAREAAAQRKQAAAEKLRRVSEEQERINADADERLAREMAELEEQQKQRMEILNRELEERRAEEQHAVVMAVKAELVNLAVDELLRRYQEVNDATLQAGLIDGFAADLERLRA